MTKAVDKRRSERVPSYVTESRQIMAKMTRRRDRVVRRYLPATAAVQTLLGYFRGRLKIEKEAFKEDTRRRMDVDWYAKFSPRGYVVNIEYQARMDAYAFLIKTLSVHAPVLGTSSDPEKMKDPKQRHAERRRFWHAPDALAAVGGWWIKANYGPIKPYVTKKERKAIGMCVRVYRLLEKGPPVGTLKFIRRFSAYLEWSTKQMKEWKKP